jgi:hypothetical protein
MNAFSAVKLSALTAVLVAATACGSTPTTPTQPDAPVYELKTETFSGNVKVGGTVAFPFTVVNPGQIQVGITALAPTSTLTMGIALGFWDPAALTCTQQLSNPTATLGVPYAANPSAPGEYCVGIFDTGNVTVSSDFTLTVTHY